MPGIANADILPALLSLTKAIWNFQPLSLTWPGLSARTNVCLGLFCTNCHWTLPPRISARYLKQLLSRVCRVAGDGKRLFFEYKLRLKNLTTEGSKLQEEEKGGKEEEKAGESKDAETKQGEATGQGVTSPPPFA